MAVAVHTNCKVYIGGYDVSGDFNKIAMNDGANEVDVKVFTNTAENVVPGVWKPTIAGSGFVQFGTGLIHEDLLSYFGVANVPVTVCPETAAAGAQASFMKAIEATYSPLSGKVGEAIPFNIAASGQGIPLVGGGKVFVAAGNKTSSSSSGIIQLGAVSASQRVYGAIHVLFASGSTPTLDVTVKSAALVGFGSPTTRLTFGTIGSLGYDFQQASGAITDQFWRVDWTIGGTGSPTFSFVVVVGIF